MYCLVDFSLCINNMAWLLSSQIKQVADMDGLACKSISSFSRVDHFTLEDGRDYTL
jgi:hypothetical protein